MANSKSTGNRAPKQKAKKKTRATEWRLYGDPRCSKGHFRPKRNLAAFLNQDGISLQEYADTVLASRNKLYDTSAYISRMLSGQVYMDDDTVVRTCAAYGLRLDVVLDMTDGDWEIEGSQFSNGIHWSPLRHVSEDDLDLLYSMNAVPSRGDNVLRARQHLVDAYEYEDYYSYNGLPEIESSKLENLKLIIDKIYPGDYRDTYHLSHSIISFAEKRSMLLHVDRWGDAFSHLAWMLPMIANLDVYGGKVQAAKIPTKKEDERRLQWATKYGDEDDIENAKWAIRYHESMRERRRQKQDERRNKGDRY